MISPTEGKCVGCDATCGRGACARAARASCAGDARMYSFAVGMSGGGPSRIGFVGLREALAQPIDRLWLEQLHRAPPAAASARSAGVGAIAYGTGTSSSLTTTSPHACTNLDVTPVELERLLAAHEKLRELLAERSPS